MRPLIDKQSYNKVSNLHIVVIMLVISVSLIFGSMYSSLISDQITQEKYISDIGINVSKSNCFSNSPTQPTFCFSNSPTQPTFNVSNANTLHHQENK